MDRRTNILPLLALLLAVAVLAELWLLECERSQRLAAEIERINDAKTKFIGGSP